MRNLPCAQTGYARVLTLSHASRSAHWANSANTASTFYKPRLHRRPTEIPSSNSANARRKPANRCTTRLCVPGGRFVSSGRRVLLRTAPGPTIDPLCRAAGIALPPAFQELPSAETAA
jgi:hypothetical protein